LRVGESPHRAIISPAAERDIVGDASEVGVREGSILPDGELIVAAADLGAVGRAGEVALRVVDLGAGNGVTAVADAEVLETGIPVPVALAIRHAGLDGHVVLIQVGTETESLTGVGEASRVDEGLERGQTCWELDSPCISMADKSQSGKAGSQCLDGSHYK
jgi:hypothetical protein